MTTTLYFILTNPIIFFIYLSTCALGVWAMEKNREYAEKYNINMRIYDVVSYIIAFVPGINLLIFITTIIDIIRDKNRKNSD